MLISTDDILSLGYPAEQLPALLHEARRYEARGITSAKYLLKLLQRDFPPPQETIALRDEGLAFFEAISAETENEEKNLGEVRKRMRELMRVPTITDGAILPDACPVGRAPATIPVGGVVRAHQAIIPSAHPSDICCSLAATWYEPVTTVSEEMDALMAATRFGPGGRREHERVDHPVLYEDVWQNPFLSRLQDLAHAHIADQGDGNHFAFLGEFTVTDSFLASMKEEGHGKTFGSLTAGRTYRVLVTHHGSRGLGAQVFRRGQKQAVEHTARLSSDIPEAAAWLDSTSETGQDYWAALAYVQRWTRANHQAIHQLFLTNLEAKALAHMGNEHNFVWQSGADDFLHGKGATPAWRHRDGRRRLGLIPLNMAEPIQIVLGKENSNTLGFAPHGAGRNLSRSAVRRLLRERGSGGSLLTEQTGDLDVRWFLGHPDVSELPAAYKNADAVRAQMKRFDLADPFGEIHPLGSIMAGSERPPHALSREDDPEAYAKPLSPKQIRQRQHRADRRARRQHRDWEDELND